MLEIRYIRPRACKSNCPSHIAWRALTPSLYLHSGLAQALEVSQGAWHQGLHLISHSVKVCTCLTQLYSLHDDLVHTSFPLVLLHHSISQQCVYMCPVHILICRSVYSSHKRACAANRSHDWPPCALSNHTSVSVWQAWGNTDCSDVATKWYHCSSSINYLKYMYIHDYTYNNIITFQVVQHTQHAILL